MNLAVFAAHVDFSQSSLSYFGYPEAVREDGNLGMAMLSERFLLKAKSASSAATEMRKTFGVPASGGEIDLSEKTGGFISGTKDFSCNSINALILWLL
jgi:phosphoserine aminotransferase